MLVNCRGSAPGASATYSTRAWKLREPGEERLDATSSCGESVTPDTCGGELCVWLCVMSLNDCVSIRRCKVVCTCIVVVKVLCMVIMDGLSTLNRLLSAQPLNSLLACRTMTLCGTPNTPYPVHWLHREAAMAWSVSRPVIETAPNADAPASCSIARQRQRQPFTTWTLTDNACRLQLMLQAPLPATTSPTTTTATTKLPAAWYCYCTYVQPMLNPGHQAQSTGTVSDSAGRRAGDLCWASKRVFQCSGPGWTSTQRAELRWLV